MSTEIVLLQLEFNFVESIFASEEVKLASGEKIYFSKRLMLSKIFNQLSLKQQTEIIQKYPRVTDVLCVTRMIRI